jgi:hypothetical protein
MSEASADRKVGTNLAHFAAPLFELTHDEAVLV